MNTSFNNYAPLRMVGSGTKYANNLKSNVGSSYKSLVGLRGGNFGIFPTEQNTEKLSMVATNFSTEDYKAMLSLQNTRTLVCEEIQRKMVDLKLKMDMARNEDEKSKAQEEYKKELQLAYQNACAFVDMNVFNSGVGKM